MSIVSRLYRRLPSVPRPLFRVYFDGQLREDDDSITGITITRGGSSPFGVTPSTIELEVPRSWFADQLNGTTVRVIVPNAAEVAALGGPAFYSGHVYDRFHGRASIVRITDNGRRRAQTVMLGSSWIAQESASKHRATLTTSYRIDQAIEALLYRSPSFYPWAILGGTPSDRIGARIEDAAYQSDINRLTADFRVLVTQTRSGAAQLRMLDEQKQRAEDRIVSTPHLTRSQALTPARMEQPNESNVKKFRFEYRNDDGTLASTERWDETTITPDAETETIDWTHLAPAQGSGSHFEHAVRGMVYENSTRAYRIPSITVDLLMLLSSENAYHRAQGVNLLSLEVGDTVNLSGDWVYALRGVHFVAGMTERITGAEWSMTLTLWPSIWVLGERWLDIPAQTWDAATNTWANDPRTWNAA